ncbi:UDP-2,4-diacetamido-2,4,6-trideoxy-beta-L-altropyranose hydrolase [Sphingomonas sp. KR3-1]|uniref:UDP-2,4-diacetamido-2,4, 6-trideoxy-beta-L-altropyranose hydrolase n=1 Tax=Sphingomonas sp. KR3-1 TaxID=3156611 RepID=UPI0032B5109C
MAVEQTPGRPIQVAFRVDASARMGGGHVMRCLTLAARLLAAGWGVTFIAAAITEPLRALLGDAGVRLIEIEPVRGSSRDASDWDRANWPEPMQLEDAARTAACLSGLRCDWLVLDHYGLDRCWEAALRSHAGRIAVIDDLANRPHDCELLLDQTYGREDADYRPLVGPDTELLIGARYALLRPEFARARPEALARHLQAGRVDRVLISLGMTDVGALTEVVARAALAVTEAQIDIVLGSAAPTLPALLAFAAESPRVTLHVDTDRVCALMVEADLAIGAAGTTSWERCCLGLPALTFAIAGNQRTIASKLAAAGAIDLIRDTDFAGIEAAISRLAGDSGYRAELARASAAICDGTGASAVAARLLEGIDASSMGKAV